MHCSQAYTPTAAADMHVYRQPFVTAQCLVVGRCLLQWLHRRSAAVALWWVGACLTP
jgi:hypothetical protein